jgi:rare lipoprotein A (peptidoglycan hydrolase)
MRAVGACFLLAFGTIAWGGFDALADDAGRAAKKPAHAATHADKTAKKPARMTAQAGHPTTGHATKRRVGKASIYHDHFQGRKTATGDTFSQNKLTAASRDLPLGSKATVTNRKNGKSVEVEVNDRGPYVDGRVIDLSKTAAERIGVTASQGVAPVVVEAKPVK